jgi:hypothetical protein
MPTFAIGKPKLKHPSIPQNGWFHNPAVTEHHDFTSLWQNAKSSSGMKSPCSTL